jgi:hypothetical protein
LSAEATLAVSNATSSESGGYGKPKSPKRAARGVFRFHE